MARYLTVTSWLLIIIAALLAAFFVPDTLRSTLTVGVSVVVYSVALFAVAIVGYGVWSGAERVLLMRAQRHQAEHDAQIKMIEAPVNHRVWAHERGGGYRNLTMDSRLYVTDSAPSPTTDEERAWQVYHQLQAPRPRVVGGPEVPMLAAPKAVPDLRTMISQIPVAIIIGAMNSGKTTLLHWVLDEYRGRAHILVLDPHGGPDEWPGARVIGTGRNWEEIGQALDGLVRLMDQRYREIGAGKIREGEHPPVVVIADEWTAINQNCANADKLMTALLTESRKVTLRLYLGCHSRRVKNLGVDRSGDLLDNVALVLLRNDGTRRWAEIETNDGEQARRQVVTLPGEYRVIDDNGAGELDAVTEPPPLEPGSDEARVIEMHLSGASLREITTGVWGKHGSYYNEKVAAILRQYQVEETLNEK